jgi:hypothetical protein
MRLKTKKVSENKDARKRIRFENNEEKQKIFILTFSFCSSRNNNFSNRSQKGVIVSSTLVQTFGIVFLSISGAAFAGKREKKKKNFFFLIECFV